MLALLGALVAGVLTTLAPCVLPLLPIIVGGAATGASGRRVTHVAVITASLGASVVAFTLLLKASTLLIDIPPEVWRWMSGGLLIVLGLVTAFPVIWERISGALSLQGRTTSGLASAKKRDGFGGAVLTGAALGPVFSSCSPLYGYVVVTVLPANFAYGLVLLLAYVVGLCGTLLLIGIAGQRVVAKLGWLADQDGWFRRVLGVVFIAVGVFIATGLDHVFQTWLIENSPVRPWELEEGFLPSP